MTPRVQDASTAGSSESPFNAGMGFTASSFHQNLPSTADKQWGDIWDMASMHRAADAVLLQSFYDHDIQLLHHVPLPGNILLIPLLLLPPEN